MTTVKKLFFYENEKALLIILVYAVHVGSNKCKKRKKRNISVTDGQGAKKTNT